MLRHTFAVHFLEDGGTIRQLQEILGHETLEPTMRYQALVRDQSNHPVLEPLITLHPEPETLVAPIFPLVEEACPRFADRLRQQLKGRFLAIEKGVVEKGVVEKGVGPHRRKRGRSAHSCRM
ncbi:MAG TPA: tyrosine-type recombinase/integrase [Kiritimatiellia bacterium]|nr:tyrosine-type recombinase/integrase [Kiritimatiellia bacterium]